MATHSSVLAWRIPGTGEPGGPLSMGLHRVRHDWSDLAAAAATWIFPTQGSSPSLPYWQANSLPLSQQESPLSPWPGFKAPAASAVKAWHPNTEQSGNSQVFKMNISKGFPSGSVVKNLPANAGDMRSIPSLRRPHMPQRNKPVCQNYWPCVLEPVLCNKRRHCVEKPTYCN